MTGRDQTRQNDLIFDIGAHSGQDTSYYLKKGFRVVAVEADPELCAGLRRDFSEPLASGQLTLVQAAISERAGDGTFYKFGTSVFGTALPERAEQYRRAGRKNTEVAVTLITPDSLFDRHGVPYFMKVDIEGADMLCIDALRDLPEKPRYLSVEAEQHDFDQFRLDVEKIASLGYGSFQLSRQDTLPFTRLKSSPGEGVSVPHRFAFGSAGPFGRDLPDDWIGFDTVIEQYRPILRRHQQYGKEGWSRSWLGRQALRAVGLYPGWHDLHARLDGDLP